MKLAPRINILALSAVLLAGPVTATISSITASPAAAATTAPACCSGGGHSGSSSGRSSNSGSHGSSSYSHGTNSSSRGTSHGYTRVPLNTGSLVTRGRMTAVSAHAVSLPRSARASGSSYTVPGTDTVYAYQQPSYWQRVISPRYGTPAYFVLLNDPFYYPTYQIPGSPWYGHPYPLGYTVSNGYFVPAGSPTPWTAIVTGILAIVALAVAFVVVRAIMNRNRSRSALPSTFGAQW
jgi:hypothetical protein